MIDDPHKAAQLLADLNAALPLPACPTPELGAILCKQVPHLEPIQICKINRAFYAGDEGGIVCDLELPGASEKNGLLVSITHLRFDPRLPLAGQIARYQKHRVKRIQREAASRPI